MSDLRSQIRSAIENVDCPHDPGEDSVSPDCLDCRTDAVMAVIEDPRPGFTALDRALSTEGVREVTVQFEDDDDQPATA